MQAIKGLESSAAKSFQKALIAIIFLIAIFAVIVLYTGSADELKKANPAIVVLASASFIISVILWTFAWAWLIKKEHSITYGDAMLVSFSSMFASFTPIQLGTDALRALLLKEHRNVPFSKGISASMLVKGLKFLALLIFSVFIVLFLITSTRLELPMVLCLLSGLAVVFLATLLFLLPLNKRAAMLISKIFRKFSSRVKLFEKASEFFIGYSDYLKRGNSSIAFLFVLCIAAWLFEFFAFALSLYSLNVAMPINSLVLLFVIIAVLERVPFTPRGLFLVEAASYILLSSRLANLAQAQIISFLAIFDFARLVFPTVLSLALFSMLHKNFGSKAKKAHQ